MLPKIDLKDRKLLYYLDLDSRQSYSELAKKLRLSKNSVIYRVNNLIKKGIIKQFHTAVDIGKLGYISFRLNLKLQGATPNDEEEIINFLKQKKEVVWLVSVEGPYTLAALILVESIEEMNAIWDDFFSRYMNFVADRLLTIMTEVSYYSRSFLLGEKSNSYEIKFITPPQKHCFLEDIDREILKIIVPDARVRIIDLAAQVKITPKTVIQRLKKLEERGIIVGYRTLFNYEKLGYQYVKLHITLHQTSMKKRKLFEAYIKNHPNIVFNDKVLGGDDVEIEMNIAVPEGLRELLDDIKCNFADIIKDYYTVTFYKEHKFLYLPVGF